MTDKMGGNETDFNIISFVLRFTFEECVLNRYAQLASTLMTLTFFNLNAFSAHALPCTYRLGSHCVI